MLHCSSAVDEAQPVLFRTGDVRTVVGTILCRQPRGAVSPATMSVTWQRCRCTTVSSHVQLSALQYGCWQLL